MKRLQLLFAFLAHTQVCYVLTNEICVKLMDVNMSCGCVLWPTEGSVRSQELPGSVSSSLVQRGLTAGLFRVSQIPSRKVQ